MEQPPGYCSNSNSRVQGTLEDMTGSRQEVRRVLCTDPHFQAENLRWFWRTEIEPALASQASLEAGGLAKC